MSVRLLWKPPDLAGGGFTKESKKKKKDISPWRVVVDSREPNDIKYMCDNMFDMEFELEALKCGDFALYFYDKPVMGIERKTVGDFVNSIVDSRLWVQSDKMKLEYDTSFYFVSGSINDDIYNHDFNVSSIFASIASLVVRRGVSLVWFERDDHLIECLNYFFIKITQGKYGDIISKRNMNDVFKGNDHYTLLKLPYINNHMAVELLSRFGNINNIQHATIDELIQVRGIGEKRAKRLREELKNVIR